MKDFVHLHTHSEYSTLDGLAHIDELTDKAKDFGMKAMALTDHGSTSGLWRFQESCKSKGIKPILGTEFYYERENDEKNGHLIVLAKNNIGLKNIFLLQEWAYVENFYRKPRINFKKLIEHKEGLIVLSACLASTFSQYLMEDDIESAEAWARKFKDEFGEDFYLEIQANSIPEQWEVNKKAILIAKRLGIEFVATNDVHYVLESDHYPHEVLLAMQVNKKMSDPKRFYFPTKDFWFKSREEMESTLIGTSKEDLLLSLETSVTIADKCNANILPGKYLPRYYDALGLESRKLLVRKIMQGARDKGMATNKEYMNEVQAEVSVICQEGYADYFLIVADYVNSARARGEIVGDGRGSAAGSKVIYLLDITRIEPKKYNLLFERFLAPGREPDVDCDFSNQEGVFHDLQEKYGKGSVAKIVTFGKMTPKAVCRKVLSTFEVPSHIINAISKAIPDVVESIDDAIHQSDELKRYFGEYKNEYSVIKRLEGTISHEGQHAGGVVIYPNLSSLLPIKTLGNDRENRIVAFDMDMLHELHFFKFDILGLETISTIKETLESIRETTGRVVDLYDIDYNDQKVYDMLCKGHVSGIFQLSNQSAKVIEQQPRSFTDLIAINALIRP